MIATVLGAIAACALALAATCATAAIRSSLGAIVGASVALTALVLAFALFGADQAALLAATMGAALTVLLIMAATIAGDPTRTRKPASGATTAALSVLLATALAFAMADAPTPFEAGGDVDAGIDALDGLIVGVCMCVVAASVWALLAVGERSALNAPSPPSGTAFPGREHAVARGVGKGLTPLIALIALALAPLGGLGAAFAGGALLGLAFALYAIVFGLEAAMRAAPIKLVRALGAGGLLAALVVGAAPAALGGAPFAFESMPPIAGASGQAIGEGALAAAFGCLAFGAVASMFLAIAGRVPTLTVDGDDAEDGSRA